MDKQQLLSMTVENFNAVPVIRLGDNIDNEYCNDCKFCVRCVKCTGCYECKECSDCRYCCSCKNSRGCNDCYNCDRCVDCEHCKNCSDCMKINEGHNIQYVVAGIQLTEEEYETFVTRLKSSQSVSNRAQSVSDECIVRLKAISDECTAVLKMMSSK